MNETPQIIHEKPMAEAVVEFLRDLLPADAESISVSYSNYKHGIACGPYWSMTGANWPSDDTQRVAGETLDAVLAAWSQRPDAKAKKIAELEAQLAVLRGQSVEVAL
jgi:hypothetical protein